MRFLKLTLDTILTALAIAGLAAFILSGGGCSPKKTPVNSPLYISGTVQTNQLADAHDFVVYATTQSEAEKAAMEQLDCKKRICMLAPSGVILYVRRPELKSK